MKVHFHKLLVPLKIQTYDGWIDHSRSLYRRVLANLKVAPTAVRKTLSTNIEDETAAFSDREYKELAVKLSLLTRSELVQVVQVLTLFGIDVWSGSGKRTTVNVKTLPPDAVQALAAYLKEGDTKGKE
jgi:hypothetical protein